VDFGPRAHRLLHRLLAHGFPEELVGGGALGLVRVERRSDDVRRSTPGGDSCLATRLGGELAPFPPRQLPRATQGAHDASGHRATAIGLGRRLRRVRERDAVSMGVGGGGHSARASAGLGLRAAGEVVRVQRWHVVRSGAEHAGLCDYGAQRND
jgi:hypothetical protein